MYCLAKTTTRLTELDYIACCHLSQHDLVLLIPGDAATMSILLPSSMYKGPAFAEEAVCMNTTLEAMQLWQHAKREYSASIGL